MTGRGPADPWASGEGFFDTVREGSLIVAQVTALLDGDGDEAVYAALTAIKTLSRSDLAAGVFAVAVERMLGERSERRRRERRARLVRPWRWRPWRWRPRRRGRSA
jgi:hypothetical protein